MPIPSTDDWRKIADGFQERWQFPNCIWALDGKHVVIQVPSNSGSTFYNYKVGFSIVLMALVDHRYCFTIIDVGGHGSNSDGGIFAQSALGKAIKNDNLAIPQPRPLPGFSQPIPHVIVADEAFPLSQNLMRPFPGKDLDEARRIYNYRLSRARRLVENSFGILASKWEVSQRRIKLQPQNVLQSYKGHLSCITTSSNHRPNPTWHNPARHNPAPSTRMYGRIQYQWSYTKSTAVWKPSIKRSISDKRGIQGLFYVHYRSSPLAAECLLWSGSIDGSKLLQNLCI